TVKRKRRKVIEQPQAGEQTPPSAQETSARPLTKVKPTKQRKQVVFVEETSQQVVYGFSNLTPAQASPEGIATFLRDHWAIGAIRFAETSEKLGDGEQGGEKILDN